MCMYVAPSVAASHVLSRAGLFSFSRVTVRVTVRKLRGAELRDSASDGRLR